MNIEELLKFAYLCVDYANRELGRDNAKLKKAAQYAVIAQAAATTAQAMMLAQTIEPLYNGTQHAIQTYDVSRKD